MPRLAVDARLDRVVLRPAREHHCSARARVGVVFSLARWGSRLPLLSSGELSVDALVLSLQTTLDPGAADALTARYDLRFGDDRFLAEIANGAAGDGIRASARPGRREPAREERRLDVVSAAQPDIDIMISYGSWHSS